MFGFLSAKLEINTEGPIKNGQSKETGNIGYTRHKTMEITITGNNINISFCLQKT